MLLTGLLQLLIPAGLAQTPPESTTQPATPSDRDTLNAAIEQYLGGDAAGARSNIEQLLGKGPGLEVSVRQDAMAWLGDILYSEAGEKAARTVFVALLSENPTYQLDSFQHPPEVVQYFESLRSTITPPTPTPPPQKPYPGLIFLPGGIHYYAHGHPGLGTTLAILQTGSLIASASTYLRFQNIPQELEPGQEDLLNDARTLRALNWTFFSIGWLSYTVPILYETGHWGTQRRVTTLSVSPTGMVVSGTF